MVMSDGVSLELELLRLFEQGILNQNKEQGERREAGYHFSGLSYDCLRQIQYSVIAQQTGPVGNGPAEEENMEGIYRMWIGTQLHLTPLTPKHEWRLFKEFEVNGKKIPLNGSIDEILVRENGEHVIVDKKFVASIPRSANDHYMRQVAYYSAVYAEQTGAKVKEGALLYFAPYIGNIPGKERVKPMTFPVDTEASGKELEWKVKTIQTAIDDGKIVDRKPGWLCKYCKFKEPCIALSGPLDGQKTLEQTNG